ncbi:ABC transporter ATP-binding protein [Actinophytocola sp.]|uniref:ABC transporter ATP-binding protein n=1 Tax=Actinophytocola sp. TaxID=1872138 RepID=UPI00389A7677
MAEPLAEPLLRVENLTVTFTAGGRPLRAVDDVSLTVHNGHTVALVGESGAGKSTVALAVMRTHRPDAGRIHFAGQDITDLNTRALRAVRRRMQLIPQDPYASLDPRMPVGRIVAEPLRVHRIAGGQHIATRVGRLLTEVGLEPDAAERLPAQFSSGQRQRIAIARALALTPELLIADEPVSSLDVSVQAQIINLLTGLQRTRGIAYLVISHDLALVHHIADQIVVMYLGRVVEQGSTEDIVARPQHPYTAALLSATPVIGRTGRERIVLRGEPSSALDRPSGCHFHPRCPIAESRCATEDPVLSEVAPGKWVRCLFPGRLMPGR